MVVVKSAAVTVLAAGAVQLMLMNSPAANPWALESTVLRDCRSRVAREMLVFPAAAAAPETITTPGDTWLVMVSLLKVTPAGRLNVKSTPPILAAAGRHCQYTRPRNGPDIQQPGSLWLRRPCKATRLSLKIQIF